MPARVEVYHTPSCPYCRRALALLDAKGVSYDEHDVSDDEERRTWLKAVTGQDTVPQIFINGRSVGGCDDLHALEAQGRLDALLVEPR